MTIHIEYDREENKIELILDSQSNVIRTLLFSEVRNFKVAKVNLHDLKISSKTFHLH